MAHKEWIEAYQSRELAEERAKEATIFSPYSETYCRGPFECNIIRPIDGKVVPGFKLHFERYS